MDNKKWCLLKYHNCIKKKRILHYNTELTTNVAYISIYNTCMLYVFYRIRLILGWMSSRSLRCRSPRLLAATRATSAVTPCPIYSAAIANHNNSRPENPRPRRLSCDGAPRTWPVSGLKTLTAGLTGRRMSCLPVCMKRWWWWIRARIFMRYLFLYVLQHLQG